LRQIDLQMLEGHESYICFLWDDQSNPLIIPFSDFEEVFRNLSPAGDGQYKVQVYDQLSGIELYIANAGRFNVESYIGWQILELAIAEKHDAIPTLTHHQVQTLLGLIGSKKGYDIWIPQNDRARLDSSFSGTCTLSSELPVSLNPIKEIVENIDVIWIKKGAAASAFFEVEHSTPIYSGLLRFNDVWLLGPLPNTRFGIVSNDERRELFVRQINRPTFKSSGLSECCNFFEYQNVFNWYRRLKL